MYREGATDSIILDKVIARRYIGLAVHWPAPVILMTVTLYCKEKLIFLNFYFISYISFCPKQFYFVCFASKRIRNFFISFRFEIKKIYFKHLWSESWKISGIANGFLEISTLLVMFGRRKPLESGNRSRVRKLARESGIFANFIQLLKNFLNINNNYSSKSKTKLINY